MSPTASASHDSGRQTLPVRMPFYSLKWLLTRVGARMSKQMVHRFSAATNYLETGRWVPVSSNKGRVQFPAFEGIRRGHGRPVTKFPASVHATSLLSHCRGHLSHEHST